MEPAADRRDLRAAAPRVATEDEDEEEEEEVERKKVGVEEVELSNEMRKNRQTNKAMDRTVYRASDVLSRRENGTALT